MFRALFASLLLAACVPVMPPPPPAPVSAFQKTTFDCAADYVSTESTTDITLEVLTCGGRSSIPSLDTCLAALRGRVHNDTIGCVARDLAVMSSVAVANGSASADAKAVAGNIKAWILAAEVNFR